MDSNNEKKVPAAYELRQRQHLENIARHYDRLEEKLGELEAKLQQSGLLPAEASAKPNKPR